MKWVFDLDGTLIDNQRAIREAYIAAGVTTHVFHRPWHEWCTPAQHKRKNELYPALLKQHGVMTPLGVTILQYAPCPVRVLTGASKEALEAVFDAFPSLRDVLHVTSGLSPYDKADWLAATGWGAYVDDDDTCRHIIGARTTWAILRPAEAEPLLRLSSPQEQTRALRALSLPALSL